MTRLLSRRFLPVLLVLAALLLTGVLVSLAEPASSISGQAGTNRAALVVRFGEDRVLTQCVTFSEPAIDGERLLLRSGLTAGFSTDGAVCSIENAGCPATDCFCRCPFPECEYWAYYHWQEGAWQYSNTGAAWSQVSDGTLHGWSWGAGDWASGVEPPVISFEDICGAGESAGKP